MWGVLVDRHSRRVCCNECAAGSGLATLAASAEAASVGKPGVADQGHAGGYMGEGMLPIPEKVVKRILELAFVEMGDLVAHARCVDEGGVCVDTTEEVYSTGNGCWACMLTIFSFIFC